MKKIILVFVAVLSSQLAFSMSNEDLRPQSFKAGEKNITFVDFTEVVHNITYNITTKTATTRSTIQFNQAEAGYPVIELIAAPTAVVVDGVASTSSVTPTPRQETQVRFINKELQPGVHTVTLEAPIKTLVEFKSNTVRSAFWFTDLEDRSYLEQYVPTNLEFDQSSVVFNVEFIGLNQKQKIFANGTVEWLSDSKASVKFPNYFTASSIFFHTAPEGAFLELNYEHTSQSGKSIPIQVYTSPNAGASQLTAAQKNLTEILNELETNFGPFPHPNLVVYISQPGFGLGGMEYCGATVTSMNALSHEIFHSYVGRGLMPANGNAGWIDEALASWRDDKYPNIKTFSASVNMSNAAPYTRKTNRAAYSHGADFMSFLNFKLADQGGLKPFIRSQMEKNLFAPYSLVSFVESMESHFNKELMPDFQKHTFKGRSDNLIEHPIHKKLTMEELKSLL